ncbi:polysaccharide lyase domain-containing protein [Lysobacter sp. HA18]
MLALAALPATFPAIAATSIAFPGAMGAAAQTPGGRGGQIIRVTTLAAQGAGSIAEALKTKGPRIVVFEVGGTIDLGVKTIKVTEPFLTIAGQTAPSPGITLIRGGIDIATHDVVVQHLRVRPGDAGLPKHAGVDFDGISTVGGRDVIVDHCSLTWATDENLSASGPRFTGDTPEQWRAATSSRITFSHNIIAEGLAESTHIKGEHSKGSLIHDNTRDILIVGNLYSNNKERNPLFKGGSQGWVINNLIYNPGRRAVHYNLIAEEWKGHEPQTGELTVLGNVMRGGPDTPPTTTFFMFGGSGPLDLYLGDNIAVDAAGEPVKMFGRYSTAPVEPRMLRNHPALPFGVTPMPASRVQDAVIADSGARPWDRDDVDRRIVADVIEGRGGIINSQSQVGGYAEFPETHQPFVPTDWNLDTMQPLKPLPERAPLR